MENFQSMTFSNLKPLIADAIKESCYRLDARLYNIANEVHQIETYSIKPGIDVGYGLSKIFDQTVKDSIGVGCDLSVIVKGLLLGAFRASPFVRQEAHKTICVLSDQILKVTFKYKGDVKPTIEGILSAVIILAKEFKLNSFEASIMAKENILSSAKAIDLKLANEIVKLLLHSDDAG